MKSLNDRNKRNTATCSDELTCRNNSYGTATPYSNIAERQSRSAQGPKQIDICFFTPVIIYLSLTQCIKTVRFCKLRNNRLGQLVFENLTFCLPQTILPNSIRTKQANIHILKFEHLKVIYFIFRFQNIF